MRYAIRHEKYVYCDRLYPYKPVSCKSDIRNPQFFVYLSSKLLLQHYWLNFKAGWLCFSVVFVANSSIFLLRLVYFSLDVGDLPSKRKENHAFRSYRAQDIKFARFL